MRLVLRSKFLLPLKTQLPVLTSDISVDTSENLTELSMRGCVSSDCVVDVKLLPLLALLDLSESGLQDEVCAHSSHCSASPHKRKITAFSKGDCSRG